MFVSIFAKPFAQKTVKCMESDDLLTQLLEDGGSADSRLTASRRTRAQALALRQSFAQQSELSVSQASTSSEQDSRHWSQGEGAEDDVQGARCHTGAH